MAVEIVILSGARQGTRLVLDAREFRVGTEPGCEVFFDAQHDPSAQGRGALVQLKDDGWCIRPIGAGGLIVNQQTIVGPKRLRSGDVVRLSLTGPDFCIRLATAAAETPKPFDPLSLPAHPLPAVPAEPEIKPSKMPEPTPTPVPTAPPSPMAPPAPNHWARWTLAALGACFVMAFLWRMAQPPQVTVHLEQPSTRSGGAVDKVEETGTQPISSNSKTRLYVRTFPPGANVLLAGRRLGTSDDLFAVPPGPAQIAVELDGYQRETRQLDLQPGQVARVELELQKQVAPIGNPPKEKDSAAIPEAPKENPPAPTDKPPPPPDLLTQLGDSVFLVEVEMAGRFWPFATCVAVGKGTLLTSAREAMQLAAWRADEKLKEYKAWAVNPTLQIKTEIREIRVHVVFAALAAKPNDWIYGNLALLSVEGDLPKVAPLASNEELGELKEDTDVACLGFAHEGKKTSAAFQLKPELFQGRIFVTTVAKNLPAQPRLLHIDAKIPHNVYGSPILDEKGRVVGVYGAPAAPAGPDASPAETAMKNVHLASLVAPEAIRLWIENRDEKVWVSATTLKLPSQPSGK